MRFFSIVPLLLVMFLTGCASTYRLDDNGQRRLGGADSAPVFLSLRDSQRVEPVKGFMSQRTKVETGKIWKNAFIGGNGAAANIEIVSSEMRQNLSGAGFAMRYTYTAEARFAYKNEIFILKGKGTRAAVFYAKSAMRQAAELAILDIDNQAKVLMGLSPTPSQ